MAAGVTFWWFPDEEQAFLSFLLSTGNIMAIPSKSVVTREELLPQLMMDYLEREDPYQVRVALEQHALQMIIKPVHVFGEDRFCVSNLTSCVLNYRRGKFRDTNKLVQSNLSATWKCLNERKTALVEKDPEFKKWAQKVFRWVRKVTPEWHQYKGYRVSRRVKMALVKGHVELVW